MIHRIKRYITVEKYIRQPEISRYS